MGKRVLVSGYRKCFNTPFVEKKLDKIRSQLEIDFLITGGAAGVDRIADKWAENKGIDRVIFPANWKKYGYGAGPIRNLNMVEYMQPELVVAFWSEHSKGTVDMMKIAKQLEIPLLKFRVD